MFKFDGTSIVVIQIKKWFFIILSNLKFIKDSVSKRF